jgi:hypothetical protein
VASAKHVVQIKADDPTYLTVVVQEVQIPTFKFNTIGIYEIVDPVIFAVYAKEGLFEFRVPTLGTHFHIYSPNKTIKLTPGRGIWIG